MDPQWRVPDLTGDWALFLDVDGTLLDIAPRPEAVTVEDGLPERLDALRRRLGGALALVSGRSIAVLDALFAPFRFAAAGVHGLERRDASGTLHFQGFGARDLDGARAPLREFVQAHPGLVLEDKGRSLALHYRLAPHLRAPAERALSAQLEFLPPEAMILEGRAMFELKSRAANKGSAIQAFLAEAPFAGRMPLFLGDDRTDQDGFDRVRAHRGWAVRIGADSPPERGWLPHPAAVRQWIAHLAG